MKRAKLKYQPVAEKIGDEIAYIAPSGHVEAINSALEQKNERNRMEQMMASKDAASFNCK